MDETGSYCHVQAEEDAVEGEPEAGCSMQKVVGGNEINQNQREKTEQCPVDCVIPACFLVKSMIG